MTDFATDLLWEEEKQPVLPVPAHPRDRQQADKKSRVPLPPVPVESQSERLQRIAGNAVLSREAEAAEATRKRLAEAARRPADANPQSSTRAAPAPEKKRKQAAARTEAADPKSPPAAREKAVERQAMQAAAAAQAQRLAESEKAAAVRSEALAQVLASFENDATKADLIGLALLVEKAPAGIGEATARALAAAVMRADPAQRAAISARLKTELGDRGDLRLARLLRDRLAGLFAAPVRSAPPAPPPPPPGPG
jgi:hypothetical protein